MQSSKIIIAHQLLVCRQCMLAESDSVLDVCDCVCVHLFVLFTLKCVCVCVQIMYLYMYICFNCLFHLLSHGAFVM